MTGHEDFAGLGLAELGASPWQPGDPSQVGPFRILARLAAGGMGRVYLARDPAEPGLAAVKVLRSEYADDADFRIRFEREVATIGLAQGPYTATLLGSDFDNDLLWIATGYLPGINLSEAVARFGLLDTASGWRLIGALAAAVGTVAGAGVVHRDVKPSNVVLTGDGAYLIDFGISQAADMSAITKTGVAVGTPAFMSPEQVSGKGTGTPSDVFSLGSVVAYALTRHAPFGDGATADVLHRIAYEPPKTDVVEQIAEQDPELADLIGRCLQKGEAERPTPAELAEAVSSHGGPAEWPESISTLIRVREERCAAVSAADIPVATQAAQADSTPTMVVEPLVQTPAADSAPTTVVEPPARTPTADNTPTTVVRPVLPRSNDTDAPGGPTRESAATENQATRNRKRAAAVGVLSAAALAAVATVAVVAYGAAGGGPAVKPTNQTTSRVASVDTATPTSAATTTEDATSGSDEPVPTKQPSTSTRTPTASASSSSAPSSPPDLPSSTTESPTPSDSPTTPATPTASATPTAPTTPTAPATSTPSATPTSGPTSTSASSGPSSAASPSGPDATSAR